MSDTPKKGSGFPGASNEEDDLLAEFDAWDKNLENLFEDEETGDSSLHKNAVMKTMARSRPALPDLDAGPEVEFSEGDEFGDDAPAIELDDVGDKEELDFFAAPQALGELLGPPPLPPPLEEVADEDTGVPFRTEDTDDGVFTSAPRPGRSGAGDQDAGMEEVTRVLDADDNLLAAALRAAESGDMTPEPSNLPLPPRRTPTIVRREDLERRRRVLVEVPDGDLDENDFSSETTRIADARQLESLVEAAAQAPMAMSSMDDSLDEPEISFAVDDEFYDDIEIGDSGGQGAAAPAQPATPAAPAEAAQRRVSPHLVRRESLNRDGASPQPTELPRPDGGAEAEPVDLASAAAAGRTVDPEMTLDMRVLDEDLLPPDELLGDILGITPDELRRAPSPEPAAQRREPSLGLGAQRRAPSPGLGAQRRAPSPGLGAQRRAASPGRVRAPSASDEPVIEIVSGPGSDTLTPVPGEDPVAAAAMARQDRPASTAGPTVARVAPAAPVARDAARVAAELDAELDAAFPEFDDIAVDAGPAAAAEIAAPDAPAVDAAPAAAAEIAAQPAAAEADFADIDAALSGLSDAPAVAAAALAELADTGSNSELALPPAPGDGFDIASSMPELDLGIAEPPDAGDEDMDEPSGSERSSGRELDVPAEAELEADPVNGKVELSAEPGWVSPEITADLADLGISPDELGEVTSMRSLAAAIGDADAPGRDVDAPAEPAATPARVVDVEVELHADGLELPAAVLAQTVPALAIDVDALPEHAPPTDEDMVGLGDVLARELALCERELGAAPNAELAIQLHVEAGRLAERLGDLDQARGHYEQALAGDPGMVPALRGLRRIERAAGNLTEAVRHLDAELAASSETERSALRAHRINLLMAAGEQDLGRVAVGEILDHEPDDVRALLTNLELAFVDGRTDELDSTLERLARVLEDAPLRGALLMLRGRLAERPPGGGEPARDRALAAYQAAGGLGLPAAYVAMARVAHRGGDASGAAAALGQLATTELGARDPGYAAALAWRRARWAGRAGDGAARRDALAQAASLAGTEPSLLAELADAAMGDDTAAADALLALAEHAPSPVEQASALVRAAEHLGRLGRDAEAADALGRALILDPAEPRGARLLEAALEAKGDALALVARGRQAILADPEGAVLERVHLAGRLLAMGRHDEAIAELVAGRQAAPDATAIADALIDTLGVAGRGDERAALLGTLADADERDPEAALLRAAREASAHAVALCQAEAGEGADATSGDDAMTNRRSRVLAAAIDLWQRVLERDPEGLEAHGACVRLAERLGDRDVLEDALGRAQAAARDPGHAVSLALRRVAIALGQAEPDLVRAEDIAREALGLVPDDPRPAVRLLALATRDGRLADVAALLEDQAAAAEAAGGADAAAVLRLRAGAIFLDAADDPGRAADLGRAVLATRLGLEPARELVRAALARMGDAVPAELLRRAPDGDGAGPQDLTHDAELALAGGDAAAAVALYRRALALEPGHALAREGLGRAARAAGDADTLAALVREDLAAAEARGDRVACADAHEALARIEADLRGDAGAALAAYQAAAAADPGRLAVLRAIERALTADGSWDELAPVRQAEIARVAPAADKVPLLLDHARLGQVLGWPRADVLASYKAAYDLDPRCRVALFHHETEARAHGASPERAALELDVADYFAEDARARAAFLTRAGETFTDLGDIDAAIARFRQAAELAVQPAALHGWQDAALCSERFVELAEAALAEAESAPTDEERVPLFHLAGVALMDRAGDPDGAARALERVLAIEPGHDDAFARLRDIYAAASRHDDLAALLTRRIDVETEPSGQARRHRALAELERTRGNPDAAREHLRAVLDISPNDVVALTVLGDIAWDQGAWDDAARALIARARMDSDPQALRVIFSRLGSIYAEKQPDPARAIQAFTRVLSYDNGDRDALEHLSRLGMQTRDFKLALGACERLISLDKDDAARVEHLHRMAEIYEDGMGDRVRAERAYRSALDSVPTSDAALSTLVRFLEKSGDTRSVRVHLDRVAATMRARLTQTVTDGVPYRVIARALTLREGAGVPGSRAVARCAAELATLFGSGDEAEKALGELVPPRTARLATAEVDELLFPAAISAAWRQLVIMLGDRIAKHVGTDIRRWGVGRGDRLKGREPALIAAEAVAADMGVEAPAVYVAREPRLLVAEPTGPVSIILGAELAARADDAEMRFVAGYALKLALTGFAVPARMTADELGVLLVALLRQFEPDLDASGMDAEAVSQQQQRLRRLIPSGLLQDLKLHAMSAAGSAWNQRAMLAAMEQMACRAGLVACGSARAALAVLGVLRGHADVHAAAGDPVIADLMRFAVSEDHVSLRALME